MAYFRISFFQVVFALQFNLQPYKVCISKTSIVNQQVFIGSVVVLKIRKKIKVFKNLLS